MTPPTLVLMVQKCGSQFFMVISSSISVSSLKNNRKITIFKPAPKSDQFLDTLIIFTTKNRFREFKSYNKNPCLRLSNLTIFNDGEQ